MGDGTNGIAAAIVVASIAIPLGLAALLGFARRAIADSAGWSGIGRLSSMLIGAAGGSVLGVCLIAATFFETTLAPPRTLRFVVPAGFRPQWTILLEDRRHGQPLLWHGHHLPFTGRSATIVVPAGGVVRVASLIDLTGDGNVRAIWNDGVPMVGFAGGRAPSASGATAFVAYQREHSSGYDPRDELPVYDTAKFAQFLSSAERGSERTSE